MVRSQFTVAKVVSLQYKPSITSHFQAICRGAVSAWGSGKRAGFTRRQGMRRRQSLFAFVVLCGITFFGVVSSSAQVNTATLTGLVSDPQGLAVRGAKITVSSEKTGTERSAVADESGRYRVVGLTPGEYKVRVEGPSTFAPYENPAFQVTVGQEATLNVTLTLGTQQQTVTVTTESAPIETTRSESAQTVEQRQINNLPINGRNYINFT
jgi:Carboxypeptidase regulatory-like domain